MAEPFNTEGEELTAEEISANLAHLKENIDKACAKAGRDPKEVTICAVSKLKPVEDIKAAMHAGQMLFGENYVQEIMQKYETLGTPPEWHMIGHLQRNKVKYIIDKVTLIHSVDSVSLAAQIEKEAARCGEKKHGAGFDADPANMGGENAENDPMLPQAIRIAIENGKISTSFIQRKLQLGYSRAGRITDAMGNMGVIGPFNGSKPREVLWSMDRYMEWMNSRGEQSSQ